MKTNAYVLLQYAMGVLVIAAVVGPIIAVRKKLAGWVNFILVSIASAILLTISYNGITGSTTNTTQLLNFGAVDIYFYIDPFSAFFVGIIAFMAVMGAFYSIEYMAHYHDYSLRSYYFNFPLFILGMIAIVTVDDLSIGFTIAWQLMTLASYFLVKFEYKEKGNIRNANKYLILMELAWVMIIGGTLFIDGVAMGDSLHSITTKIGATKGIFTFLIYGLILAGFGFKAGIFPFGQFWLPDAHSIAPSPISALLSGVMIKTGVYGIIRTFFWMVPTEGEFQFNGYLWGFIISSIGVVTLFIGTNQALKQDNAKRLHAYSSIGQMGYIVFGIGTALLLLNTENEFLMLLSVLALIGALFHTLNHSVFKGLLFLSTGSLLYATGTKDLNKLGGHMKLMPVTAIVAGIASLSVAGMPSFSGFVSKWTIISSSILAGSELFFLAIFGIIALFTSAMTLATYVKFFGMAFASSGMESTGKKEVKEVPFGMLLPKIVLAALCLVQGLIPYFYFQIIMDIFKKSHGWVMSSLFESVTMNNYIMNNTMGVSVTIPGLNTIISSVAVPAIVLLVLAAGFVFAWLLKKSGGAAEKEVPTWLCGYQDANDKNRFTSKNMYFVFKKALWWTGGNVKK